MQKNTKDDFSLTKEIWSSIKACCLIIFVLSVFMAILHTPENISYDQNTDKELKARASVLKLNKYQRIDLYKRLADRVCEVYKKPGSAIHYENCMTEMYEENYNKWEAEVRLAGRE